VPWSNNGFKSSGSKSILKKNKISNKIKYYFAGEQYKLLDYRFKGVNL